MPQPLRRRDAPINWDIESVANHPVLTSGVGACILAYAQAEALMGIYLAHIRWNDCRDIVESWSKERTANGKLALVRQQAALSGPGHIKLTGLVLDSFVSLSKRRAHLAHGVFGIITDRNDEYAWRKAGSPASAFAAGMRAPFGPPIQQKTWVYTSSDFRELAQGCADVCRDISTAVSCLTVGNAFMEACTTGDGS